MLKKYNLECPTCGTMVFLPTDQPECPWCSECSCDIDLLAMKILVDNWSVYLNDRKEYMKTEGAEHEGAEHEGE